jgi:hypothetical protein
VVSFVRSRTGQHRYEGETLVFDREADLERHRALLRDVQREGGRLSTAMAANKEKEKNLLSEFEDWARDLYARHLNIR